MMTLQLCATGGASGLGGTGGLSGGENLMEHQDLVVYHPLGVLWDLLLGVKYTTVTSS